MASSNKPAQDTESDTLHKRSQSQTEVDVYDLDDPYLVPKVLSQPPKAAGTVTCRFLAIPLNESASFSKDIAQYGHIVHESKDKLIMRVPPQNTDLMDRIRQVWVSKYLTPFTECRITFDLPKRDRTTTVIIQRVLTKVNKSTVDSLLSDTTDDTASDDSTTDERTAVLLPEPPVGGETDTTPRAIRRRRATSLPLPDVLAELGESPWHHPQILS